MRRMILAAIVAVSAHPVIAQDATPAVPRLSIMTVVGQARRDVAPDMAVVSVGVTNDRPTAAAAAAETGRVAKAIVDEAKAAGIPVGDIGTSEASLTALYDTGRNGTEAPKLKAFRAANLVRITVREIARTGDLVGQLINKGANDLQGIDFSLADPQPVLDDLRAAATKEARRRAEIYANAAGVSLGRILEISPEATALPMPMRRMKADVAMAAVPAPAPAPVEAGTQTFEAQVSVTWVLDQRTP